MTECCCPITGSAWTSTFMAGSSDIILTKATDLKRLNITFKTTLTGYILNETLIIGFAYYFYYNSVPNKKHIFLINM